MNLPDAKVSQVCSNCMEAQRHHCQWASSCSLVPQKEAVAEMCCSGFCFQEPEEEKGVFQIAGDDRKGQTLLSGEGYLDLQLPELLETNLF